MTELSKHTIHADRWDREDNDRQRQDNPMFRVAGDKLKAFTPTGQAAMDDMFWSLFKANPELRPAAEVQPSHRVNLAVQTEMRELGAYGRMRRYSVGDDLQASLVCSTMEPDLETIFDRFESEQSAADHLQSLVDELAEATENTAQADQDLADLLAQLDEDSPAGPALDAAEERASDAAERQAQLQQAADEQSDDLDEKLARKAGTLATMVQDMLGTAVTDAEGLVTAASAWGLAPGELQRLPAKERLELAQKLNSPRFREIAERFGALHNLQLSAAQERTVATPQEMYDVEYGNDLSKILPSELLALRHPALRLDFYRRFVEKDLMQYAMQGKEKLSRGGIILPLDSSGSMAGPREQFAKGLMLALLNLAKAQKRTMHVIHFSSPGQFTTQSFTKPEDFTFERIVDAAETFMGGGTCFQTPMRESLRILQEEFAAQGGVHADVVFVTDDECRVAAPFMEEYLSEMHRMQATTWGVACSGRLPTEGGALLQMTEGKVALMKDFQGTSSELRQVFRDVA